MSVDWTWFDRHAGAIQAVAAMAGLAFTAALLWVGWQQHRILHVQERRSRPRLALGEVTTPTLRGDMLDVIFEVGNTGGSETNVHRVHVHLAPASGSSTTFVGRVIERRSAGASTDYSLRAGERATFRAEVPLGPVQPGPHDEATLAVLAFGGEPKSEPVACPRPNAWAATITRP